MTTQDPSSAAPAPHNDQVAQTGERLVQAQLASAYYLRSVLMLIAAVLAGSAGVSLGNQAEFEKILKCAGSTSAYSSACYGSGGGFFYVVGGALSLLFIVIALVAAVQGSGFIKRARG